MRNLAALVVLLAATGLAACVRHERHVPIEAVSTADVPSRTIVYRIEAHLQREPCIGALSQWARFYRWLPAPAAFNGSLTRPPTSSRAEVEVILREAGKFGYRAGHFVEPSPPPLSENEFYLEHDDRDYRVGFGLYDIASDRLTLRSCGSNLNSHPGELVGHIRP